MEYEKNLGQQLNDENAHLPYCSSCTRTAEPYPTTDGRYLSGCCDAPVRVDSFSHALMDAATFEIWLEATDE